MLLYPDHLQNWLDNGHGLVIFLILALFWLSETGQIWGCRAFWSCSMDFPHYGDPLTETGHTCIWGFWALSGECVGVNVNGGSGGIFPTLWVEICLVLKIILMIDGWLISCKIVHRWMSPNLTDDKSTLLQVMAWCCQAASHYLNQCWLRSLTPYGVTRPQWDQGFTVSIDLCQVNGTQVCY